MRTGVDRSVSEFRNWLTLIACQLDILDTELEQCCTNRTGNGSQELGKGPLTVENLAPQLEQNQPDPFRENSTIKYYLPHSTISSQLIISDLNGVVLKTFNLEGKGFGQILISRGSFAARTYMYTFTVNGGNVAT